MSKVIEIIGIAGSGKSTLTKKIKTDNRQWNTAYRMPRKKTLGMQLVAFFRHVIPVLMFSEKGWHFNNMRMLIHIEVVSMLVSKEESDNVLVFDQGIVFEYASLCCGGLKNAPKWYLNKILVVLNKSYFKALNIAVFLDANDEVLFKRVMLRNTDHRLKEFSQDEMHEFFIGYKNIYQRMKEAMLNYSDIKIIEINTDDKTADEVYVFFKDKLGLEL